jgi:peptidoglycan/xylan/chitin deacetylase (PgdA/CDA1 family)
VLGHHPGVRVALTFDTEGGYDVPGHTVGAAGWSRVLDVLRAQGVPATFFLQADWLAAHPALGRSTAAQGHLLGNHTLNHVALGRFPERLDEQVGVADAVVRAVLPGVDLHPWFRLPYFSGDRDAGVLAGLAARGWEHVGASADSRDWDPVTAAGGPDRVVANVLDDVDRGPAGCAVVLLHTWPAATGPALPDLIAELRRRGAEFCRVDELTAGQRAALPARDGG